jgi:hypothetical protein
VRHAQTFIRECFAFSAHPCAFQPHIYESSDGELIGSDKHFERALKSCY